MIDKDLTILIPTFKRPNHIERLLDSFVAFEVFNNISIYILDSSPIDFKKKYSEVLEKFKETLNITYYHYEVDIIFTKKLFLGLGLVETPYVIIATDDDMLNPNAVIECVKQIKINKNVSNVTGETLLIEKNRKQNFVTHYMPNIVANLETGIDRGWHTCYYRSHSLITLNNVWKKNDLFNILETLSNNIYKKYTECMYGLLSSYSGKTLLIPKIMILRTKNLNREEYRMTSLPKFNEEKSKVFQDASFQYDLSKFLETSQKILLSEKEDFDNIVRSTKKLNPQKKIIDKFEEVFLSQFFKRFLHNETFAIESRFLKRIKNPLFYKFILKIIRRIKFLQIIFYPKSLVNLFKTIELYGYSGTRNLFNKDPKMRFNIISLLKNKTKNDKDFNVIFKYIKKYDN